MTNFGCYLIFLLAKPLYTSVNVLQIKIWRLWTEFLFTKTYRRIYLFGPKEFYQFIRGLFTWPNQDDRMNMTEIGEHDWKIDNDEH